jgi:hypothetical protein
MRRVRFARSSFCLGRIAGWPCAAMVWRISFSMARR